MTKFDAIGIVCQDLEVAARFYRLLGVEVPEVAGEDHVEALLPGGIRLMFDSLELVKSFTPDYEPPAGNRMGMAFLCDSPAGVDATYQAILDAGFAGAKEPWDAFWGQRYAQVIDPDGNKVDLFAPLEVI